MPTLLFAILVLFLLWFAVKQLAKANPKTIKTNLRKVIGVAAVLGGIALTLRGGAAIGGPIFLIGLGLLGLGHLAGIDFPFGGKTPGQKSAVRTGLLEMELDHDSGNLDGTVLSGAYEGRKLSDLSRDEVMQLYEVAATTPDQSAQLLEAYLDQMHGDWREQYEGGTTAGGGEPPGATPMSVDEALQILGLPKGAGDDDIVKAHRRLMKKYHPDTGGSDYLAAKINEAKDLLLNKQG